MYRKETRCELVVVGLKRLKLSPVECSSEECNSPLGCIKRDKFLFSRLVT
jgi:hypothetical protein